jgi:hypothetical protein
MLSDATSTSSAEPMDRDEAVREVAWIAREARELAVASNDAPEPAAAWQTRRDAYMVRKEALLAYIESTKA